MSSSRRLIHRSDRSSSWSVLIGGLCVWMSLGCIVLEEGGEETEPEPQGFERPRPGDGGDEFEDFEDLNPGEPIPTMNPMEPMQPMEPDSSEDFILEGRISGGPEQGGELVVLWYVTTGEAPFFYKYGDGDVLPDGTWRASIPDGAPPAEALNVDGVGVALVMGLKQWTGRMDDGALTREEFRAMEQSAFGLSRDHALVFIEDGATPLSTRRWAEDFGQGAVACGAGRTDESRGVAAISCDAFELVVTREFSWLMF